MLFRLLYYEAVFLDGSGSFFLLSYLYNILVVKVFKLKQGKSCEYGGDVVRFSIKVNYNPVWCGGVAEWSNALAWKAGIPKGIAGSNPVSSAIYRIKPLSF